jgi:hypothetical protein
MGDFAQVFQRQQITKKMHSFSATRRFVCIKWDGRLRQTRPSFVSIDTLDGIKRRAQ